MPGIQEQDYRYLDHVYTRDNPDSYELIAHWRKLLDNFSDYHEQDEKVSVKYFHAIYIDFVVLIIKIRQRDNSHIP